MSLNGRLLLSPWGATFIFYTPKGNEFNLFPFLLHFFHKLWNFYGILALQFPSGSPLGEGTSLGEWIKKLKKWKLKLWKCFVENQKAIVYNKSVPVSTAFFLLK